MTEGYVAYVDKDLEELVPTFLENRRKDVETMLAALQQLDFDTLHTIAHQIKGSGGGCSTPEPPNRTRRIVSS